MDDLTLQRPTALDADLTLTYSVRTANLQLRPALDDAGRSVLSAEFRPGVVLGDRYELQEELGRGGMGIVFLARDRRLDRNVAVKGIRPFGLDSLDSTERAVELFEQEARLGAALLHPAIATVFDYGFCNGTPYTVFEYVAGETLRKLLSRRGTLPPNELEQILPSLAQALDYAHSHRIVHRDLKPENIRATPQGQFKILDLGLAKRFTQADDWYFAGTPAYAAPEQAEERPADGRADQYSLAVIAFELLTGTRPFQSADPLKMLEMHRHEEPRFPAAAMNQLPARVTGAVLKGLQKNPNDRFATCGEFVVALGCTHRLERIPSQNVLKEFDCISLPVFPAYFLSAAFLPLVFFPIVAILRPLMTLHVELSSDALWLVQVGEIRCFLIQQIQKIEQRGTRLILTYESPPRQHRLNLAYVADCEMLYADLRELKGKQVRAPEPDQPSPVGRDVLLSNLRPRAGLQLLGELEARHSRKWGAEDKLRLHGAMAGAEAIVDVRIERGPGGNSSWIMTGTAVRSVDPSLAKELRQQANLHEARRIGYWCLSILLCFAIFKSSDVVVAAILAVPHAAIFMFVLALGWPLLLATSLTLTRWRTLIWPSIFSVCVVALAPITGFLATFVGAALAGKLASPVLWLSLLLNPVGWLFLIFFLSCALLLLGRVKRSSQMIRSWINVERQRVLELLCIVAFLFSGLHGIVYLGLESTLRFIEGYLLPVINTK